MNKTGKKRRLFGDSSVVFNWDVNFFIDFQCFVKVRKKYCLFFDEYWREYNYLCAPNLFQHLQG